MLIKNTNLILTLLLVFVDNISFTKYKTLTVNVEPTDN